MNLASLGERSFYELNSRFTHAGQALSHWDNVPSHPLIHLRKLIDYLLQTLSVGLERIDVWFGSLLLLFYSF